VRSGSRAFVWCGKQRALGLDMAPIRSSPHRILHRILRPAWDTTRGPRCFQGLRFQFSPPSPLVRVPMSPTGQRPPSRIRMPAHREASTMDFVRPRTSPRGSFTSVALHRSPPRAKGIQRRRTTTFLSPRSRRRSSTTSRTLNLRPARDRLSNRMHHRLCITLKTLTIRPSRISTRIRPYPRYQVPPRVSPPPSSTIAAINF
jgi:hypothetical protein